MPTPNQTLALTLLRNTTLHQGRGSICRIDDGITRYCAIGIFAHHLATTQPDRYTLIPGTVKPWESRACANMLDKHKSSLEEEQGMRYDEIAAVFDLASLSDHIVRINDNAQLSFAEIANNLEAIIT